MTKTILARYVRAFTTYSRPIRSQKFVEALLRETQEPIWRLVSALNTPRSPDLSAALYRHGVSVDQFRHWRPLVVESNISTAIDIMQRSGLIVHPFQSSRPKEYHLPSWLVAYLISFKIRTIDNAFPAALDLAYSHLPAAPFSVQGPLLILTLLGLARFGLLIPMRRVLDTFLITNLDHPQLYFNLLLQALACTPLRTVDTANFAVTILQRMEARQLKLIPATYESLLSDRFVTLQLTKYLRDRMTHEGIVPTAKHLEAYLRVFSKFGKINGVKDYLEAIHDLSSKALTHTTSDGEPDPVHRANTLVLGASDDRASAFTFLQSLLDPQLSPIPKRRYSITAPKKHSLSPVQKAKFKSDIYTYTAALSVAARDHTLSSAGLVALFNRTLNDLSPAPPTVATFTVLLQGLYSRKSYGTALTYWQTLADSGLPLDRQSLSIGIRILVRLGKPHVAWSLLESHTGGGGDPYPATMPNAVWEDPREPNTVPKAWIRAKAKSIQLSIITINDFLVALNRVGRPDVVFKIWDNMQVLYGVSPDARTLSLLLQAARLAKRLDDSVEGAMVRLKYEFRKPFGGADVGDDGDNGVGIDSVVGAETTLDTRSKLANEVTSLLGPPSVARPYRYRSSLWHNKPPHEHALLVFEQALFGAVPDPKKLLALKPPAYAVRKHSPSSGLDTPEAKGWGLFIGLPGWGEHWTESKREDVLESPDMLRGLLKRRRLRSHPLLDVRGSANYGSSDKGGAQKTQAEHQADDSDVNAEWETYHPTVTPTSENYFHYILLLGLTDRGTEVARVLGWMRETGVQPAKYNLAAALVLWREVCVDHHGPLVEGWKSRVRSRNVAASTVDPNTSDLLQEEEQGTDRKPEERDAAVICWDNEIFEGEERGQYAKLVKWIVDWVGVKRLPSQRDLATWTRNIARAREGGRTQQEVEEAFEQAKKGFGEEERGMKEEIP